MERMTKIDENIQTAQNMLSWIVERCYELEEENKKLKERIDELEKCNLNLQERLDRKEEVNKKMREELSECECSFWFESDEVWFWKREYKRLKKWIKDHCKWYWNLFPEDEMKRQWKKADKKRK